MLKSIVDTLLFFVDLIRGLIQIVIMLVTGLIDLIRAILVVPAQLPVMLGWLPPAVFVLVTAMVTITIIKLVAGRNG